jgi:hypothetical protein
MVTEVMPAQAKKANSPIFVTELEMVTEVMPAQAKKAPSPIDVTE